MRPKATVQAMLGAAAAILASNANAVATQARYVCSGGAKLTAEFSPPSLANGRVTLTFATGRRIVLPQAMSADGGRYADNRVEFLIKGRNATLTRAGHSEACSTQ